MDATEVRKRFTGVVPLFIDGKKVPAAEGKTLELINPADGSALAQVAAAGGEDIDRAVRAARRAFGDPVWRKMPASKRSQVLWSIADTLDKHTEELGWIESLNNGKTLREGKGDVAPSSDIFRYYGGFVTKIHGETIPVDGDYLCYTLREPVGVCGLIVPWNYPLLMACWKVAPALAAGNTVVLKPSEYTPLTALVLGDICKEAGLPDGVLNVVPGYGDPAGEALARHPDVDKIAFTGSIRTARRLLHASADTNLKKLSLELGGKSPLVILDDGDVDAAVKACFWGIFANKGEVCSASSRVIAHRKVKDQFVEKVAEKARAMKVGDPLDSSTMMGAQVSARQLDTILRYIEIGKKEGAKLVAGGERDIEGAKSKGYFVKPTVFDDVKPTMTIAQEEIFGPVLAVLTAGDDDEAVALANGTTYGLVAAVFTKDVGRAHRLARAVSAGTVWINMWNGFDSASPFGGMKQSGWGREMGIHALEHYTQTKTIWVPT
ncbi:MAG TPA: aldehyde dehydrogenase family protein [Polyangiaceae bacterium]|nr:aldehyde dehydrogenase family protein [Polyangiaceae bacterium]